MNITCEDNASMIKLAENRRSSSGRRTYYFYVTLFYITNEINIEYYSSNEIIRDFVPKPLAEKKFMKFKYVTLNSLLKLAYRITLDE